MPRRLLLLATLAAAVAVVACRGEEDRDPRAIEAVIDWVDFLKLDGIHYEPQALRGLGRTTISEEQHCALHGVVEQHLADNITDPMYRSVDGDASFLPKGTKIYEIDGYAAWFRVAAETEGELLLYEVADNPNATHGRDILDIEGKVTRISVNTEPSTLDERRALEDQAVVETLVGLMLDAPVVEVETRSPGAAYPLVFHLTDGTTVRRVFWPSTGILGRGLQLPPEFGDLLEASLRPVP